MRKKVGIIKRLFTLLLVFLFSINSFAAVVSDNDGSAFISKAEFDSLKNSFQGQLDEYNTSIDSKIDGAIASYLAGIRVSLPWNIKNKSVKFLNTWKYKVPQSYYQIALNTTSVTYGVSGFAPPEAKEDWGFPSNPSVIADTSPYSSKPVTMMTSYDSSNTSARIYCMFYVWFEGLKSSLDRNDIKTKLENVTYSKLQGYYASGQATYINIVTNDLGIQKTDFKKVTIGLWTGSSWQSVLQVFNNYPPSVVAGTLNDTGSVASSRQLNENNRTETPAAVDCTAVQVSDDGGKLIIDPKPFAEIKIQNVCTVDCFNYQDKSSSYTDPNAYNDSAYNGVTVSIPEEWSWNTKKTAGTQIDKGNSTASKNNYFTVQNFISFTKASSQELRNTTWGKPSYTTNVVMVDDSLSIDKNGKPTTYYTTSQGTYTGVAKWMTTPTATTINTGTSTIYYPKLEIPKYTYKQYEKQIYDYYSNDFTDGNGDMIKWGEGVLVGDCQSERSSSRVTINYHIENMSGTAVANQPCNFELSTKKFVKCESQSGTSLGTKSATPTSSTTNTVTIDIGATNEKAEMWLNAYCATDGFTVVIDNIAAE